MERFETAAERHGEHGVQAILENWERYAGVDPAPSTPLAERWALFLLMTDGAAAEAA